MDMPMLLTTLRQLRVGRAEGRETTIIRADQLPDLDRFRIPYRSGLAARDCFVLRDDAGAIVGVLDWRQAYVTGPSLAGPGWDGYTMYLIPGPEDSRPLNGPAAWASRILDNHDPDDPDDPYLTDPRLPLAREILGA